MKLLIVTQAVDKNDPLLGFFHAWLLEFAKHTTQLTVFALRVGEYDLPQNVTVVPLRGRKRNRIETALRFLYELYVRRDTYDAVFVHMNPEYVLLGGPTWKVLGKKVSLWYTHKHVGFRLRLAEQFVDHLFTASKESLRLTSKKVRVMGHGIAMPVIAHIPANNSTIRILTVGRISATKRTRELLEALSVLYDRGISFTCTVVGAPATKADKEYFAELQDRLKLEPFYAHITWVGAVPHDTLPDILSSADVFVNLSSTGSLDKAVLEALVVGVPTVTSNEAFKDILSPVGLYVASTEPKVIADMIKTASETDITELSLSVRKTHSLSELIPAILHSI